MRCGAGGATTICSPTCSAPAWSGCGPSGYPGCTGPRPPWHELYGCADDAVRHALAAGDTGWAARLVERHMEALLRRREDATLDRWLSALPAALVRARPRLCLAQAFASIAG